jgi:hypothetical protein
MRQSDRNTFKSQNGDLLCGLLRQREDAQAAHALALDKFRSKVIECEHVLRPLRDSVSRHEAKIINLSCRLNTWWNEYKAEEERLEAKARRNSKI